LQPAVAGGAQERRRCSEEILKTVKQKKIHTDNCLANVSCDGSDVGRSSISQWL
jgi:hypothetical protein